MVQTQKIYLMQFLDLGLSYGGLELPSPSCTQPVDSNPISMLFYILLITVFLMAVCTMVSVNSWTLLTETNSSTSKLVIADWRADKIGTLMSMVSSFIVPFGERLNR